ncbi:MAG: site-2 protease family protein [Chloroflexi bacterium]|jgi:membrane-associated protease RseP (regulator of RpoE activity)|nr:site-2 protease family protein [Chloroflexota bacterium]
MTYQTDVTPAESHIVDQLRAALDGLMTIEAITVQTNDAKPHVQFTGTFPTNAPAAVFDELERRFERLGYTPQIVHPQEENGKAHALESDWLVLHALPVVADKKTGNQKINAVLFVLTVLSVLVTGALQENVDIFAHPGQIWRGWPFAVTLLGILTAHELSHYFMGRRYGSPVSLPYFIPLPLLSILGTMGAVIVQRAPMRSRKALFDIGAAGPIGGLIVAIPLLIIGLMFSKVGQPSEFIPIEEDTMLSQEGNSLLYLGSKYLVHGEILPNEAGEDVWLSPPSPGGTVAFAAWAGLLVTSLNLFPVGQFDGGHIAYAMWGRKGWKIARGFVALMFAWGVFLLTVMGNVAGTTWLVWGGVSLLMGPRHPPPLNDVTPLDAKRKRLGWLLVIIFILILTPIPLITKQP